MRYFLKIGYKRMKQNEKKLQNNSFVSSKTVVWLTGFGMLNKDNIEWRVTSISKCVCFFRYCSHIFGCRKSTRSTNKSLFSLSSNSKSKHFGLSSINTTLWIQRMISSENCSIELGHFEFSWTAHLISNKLRHTIKLQFQMADSHCT